MCKFLKKKYTYLCVLLIVQIILAVYIYKRTGTKHKLYSIQDGSSMSPQKVVHVARNSTSICPQIRRPENVHETFQFQKVDGMKETLVFSAFFDERDKLVRVIAITVRSKPPSILCHLWYDVTDGVSSDLTITRGTVEILGDHHNRRLSAAYFHCPLPKNSSASRLPYAVSVTTHKCHRKVKPPTNVLKVVGSEEQQGPKPHNFTVCIKPVHGNYSRAHEVVEFIEMNRLLGATKFMVYTTSPAPNVLQVLNWYQAQGIVEIINWPILQTGIKFRKPTHIVNYGHYAAKGDCLYRSRRSTRYMVTVDWDEILMPKNHSTWMELIQFLNKKNRKEAVEYSFACLFFRKEQPRKQEDFPGKGLALKYQSNYLLVNRREKIPVRFPKRAKYISDPEKIHVAGIHFVLEHRNSSSALLKTIQLPQKIASSYHYRMGKTKKNETMVDDDMLRFKDPLLRHMKEVWEHLPNVSLS